MQAAQGEGLDERALAAQVEGYIRQQRRTGNDLPAFVNLRPFFTTEDMREVLQQASGASQLQPSQRRQLEFQLWQYGRFAVTPLAEIVNDPTADNLHGPALFARLLRLSAVKSGDSRCHGAGRSQPLLKRNAGLQPLRLAVSNGPDGYHVAADELAQARASFTEWWKTYNVDFAFSAGDRYGAVVGETGFILFFSRLFGGSLYSHQRDRYVFDLIGERWAVSFWLQFVSVFGMGHKRALGSAWLGGQVRWKIARPVVACFSCGRCRIFLLALLCCIISAPALLIRRRCFRAVA